MAGALVVPAAADAGVVSVANGVMTFRAGAGEVNDVRDVAPGLTDLGAPLTAGAGCWLIAPGQAGCAFDGGIDATLRDGDDHAVLAPGGPVTVSGGPGDDTIDADSITASATVIGDGGDDDLTVGGDSGQTADGGAGNDTIHVRGYYGTATANGGGGRDTISFTEWGDQGLAVPTLSGGAGDDTIISQPIAGGIAAGGDGNDTITIQGEPPVDGPPPYGNPVGGSFTITGGAGDDRLSGGPDGDTVAGGPGRDVIDVAGGGADTVTCGDGRDVVRYDASDTVAADCEVRLLVTSS